MFSQDKNDPEEKKRSQSENVLIAKNKWGLVLKKKDIDRFDPKK